MKVIEIRKLKNKTSERVVETWRIGIKALIYLMEVPKE
jgi:hypothetical protein